MVKITVKVKYYGLYRVITGIDSEYLEIPEHSYLGSFLSNLIDKYGDKLGKLLFDEFGEPWNILIIAVNNDSVSLPDTDRELRDGDIVRLLSPVVGG